MKIITRIAAIGSLLLLPCWASAATWAIDPDHSNIQFKVRHLMVSNVSGKFGKFQGTVVSDEKDLRKSMVDMSIDAASVNTGVAKRDDDLRSPNFLDVAKYPTITFRSNNVETAGEGMLKVTGDLTIHGVTRSVVLDVEGPTPELKDPWGKVRRGVSATTKINRKDFGLTWNQALEAGGVVVGDAVTIAIDAEFVRE
ncbi:MAG: YceI family protein [Candidatus Peribacteraceae bacterium]